MDTLAVDMIVKQSFAKGLKNMVPLLVNVVLWILTLWIPYLNVGTTIGLFVGITTKMAKDQPISMTEIFDPVFRKRMGEFFLVASFIQMGIWIGIMFFVIPGIVIGLSWSLAILLVIDKELSPMDAINKSNTLTYGKKWTIFLGRLVLFILAGLAVGIAMAILGLIFKYLGTVGMLLLALAYIAAMACFISIAMASKAVIYAALVK
ncbi:MAG: hypothetical protein EPN93_15625 [Spirochaetes bacterium]|nr:MAG: hypothetical protein EPN93_15625 [Spirochaetota bacterium]